MQWQYTDDERACWEYCKCYDCGLQYSCDAWCDVVIPNKYWEMINPTYHKGSGLLCFNCIAHRLTILKLKNIPIKITSGPFICT